MKADPLRAQEVRTAFAGPVRGLAKRLWPDVNIITCAKSGGFAHCAQMLKDTYTHGINMVFWTHIATEGLFGVVYEDGLESDTYTLATHCTFMEFIPVEHMEEEN